MSSEPTTVLGDTGLLTNPVFVQDLAIWLPLLTTAAVVALVTARPLAAYFRNLDAPLGLSHGQAEPA